MSEGRELDLTIERPAAGGRMVARHDGQVVLVSGALPGERVRARVEQRTRQVTWAAVVDVIDASPDRRDVATDPACGGMVYAHVRYDRQLALKSEIVSDAFQRIGRLRLPAPVPVRPSPRRRSTSWARRTSCRSACSPTKFDALESAIPSRSIAYSSFPVPRVPQLPRVPKYGLLSCLHRWRTLKA